MITIATYGRNGSSARVRIHDWLDYLGIAATQEYAYLGKAENSFTTLSRHMPQVVAAERSLRRLAQAGTTETLLMSREASPLSNGRLERRLLRSAQFSVYDFDDAIFHNGAPFPYSLYPKGKLWHRSVQAATQIIAGNDYLAEEAAKLNHQVAMIPSCVNPDDYRLKSSYELPEVPTLVWLGSPSTEPFLEMLTEPLLRINAEIPLRLRLISSGHRSLGPLDQIVDRTQWYADSFAYQLAGADVGLMPLPDTPFTRGKCAYKLLQYSAAGLPVVGSPVGTNKKVLADLGGASAEGAKDWEDAIRDLLASSSRARSELGVTGRRAIETGYSFRAWAPKWKAIVRL